MNRHFYTLLTKIYWLNSASLCKFRSFYAVFTFAAVWIDVVQMIT